MLLISHRGNIHGRKPESENHPEYIKIALRSGFYVECDLIVYKGQLILAHPHPDGSVGWSENNRVDEKFLQNPHLLVHCKTHETLIVARQIDGCHFFYHDKDDFTVTSKGWPIAHSSQGAKKKTICMLPEINGLSKESIEGCLGVCSDMISFYE